MRFSDKQITLKEYFKRNGEFEEKYKNQFGNDDYNSLIGKNEIKKEKVINGDFSEEERKIGFNLIEIQKKDIERIKKRKVENFKKKYNSKFNNYNSLINDNEIFPEHLKEEIFTQEERKIGFELIKMQEKELAKIKQRKRKEEERKLKIIENFKKKYDSTNIKEMKDIEKRAQKYKDVRKKIFR